MVPGVKMSNLDTAYTLDYNDDFELTLVMKRQDVEREIEVPIRWLSEDFFTANHLRITPLVQQLDFFTEPRLNLKFIDYIKKNSTGTGKEFILSSGNYNIHSDRGKILNILLTEFVIQRSVQPPPGERQWLFFSSVRSKQLKREQQKDYSMSKLDSIVKSVYDSYSQLGE
jgi:hypothetical protein